MKNKTYLISFFIVNFLNLIFSIKYYLFSQNLVVDTIDDFLTNIELILFFASLILLIFTHKKMSKPHFRLLLFYVVGSILLAIMGGAFYIITGLHSYDLSYMWNRVGYFFMILFYIINSFFAIYLLKNKSKDIRKKK